MVIIGGGYIGLEVAAVSKTLGLNVTVIEMASRILERVTSPTISSFYNSFHESKGVKILTSTSVKGINGDKRFLLLKLHQELLMLILLLLV